MTSAERRKRKTSVPIAGKCRRCEQIATSRLAHSLELPLRLSFANALQSSGHRSGCGMPKVA